MSSRPAGAPPLPRRRATAAAAAAAAAATASPSTGSTGAPPPFPPVTYTVERAAGDRVRVTGMGAALAAHAAHAGSATCSFDVGGGGGGVGGGGGDGCVCEMPCEVGPDGSMECVLPPACGVAGGIGGGAGGGCGDAAGECAAGGCATDAAGGGGGGGGGCGGGGGGGGCGGGGSRGGGGPLGLSVRLGSVFATPRLTLGLAGPQCGVCGSYGFGCRCGALALLAGPPPPPPVGVVPDTDTPSAAGTAATAATAGGGAPGKDASFGGGGGGGCALNDADGSDGLCTDDAPSAAAPLRWASRLAVAAVGAQRRALAVLQRTRGGRHRFSLWDQCVAEAVGTALIVIFGVGVVCTATLTGSASGLWQVASVWGFGVALAILCTASVSGAHLNPAVSLAFALFRPDDFPWHKLLPYWAAQYTGGVVGGAINLALFGPLFSSLEARQGIVRGEAASVVTASAFGEYFPNPGFASSVTAADVSPLRAMAVEAWGTGVLMFVILAIIDSRQKLMGGKEMIPFYIGFTVAVLISLYAPLTQAGWNPARDFGPRIVAALAGWGSVAIPGPRNGFWVYIVGPKIGAPLGALAYDMLIAPGLDQ